MFVRTSGLGTDLLGRNFVVKFVFELFHQLLQFWQVTVRKRFPLNNDSVNGNRHKIKMILGSEFRELVRPFGHLIMIRSYLRIGERRDLCTKLVSYSLFHSSFTHVRRFFSSVKNRKNYKRTSQMSSHQSWCRKVLFSTKLRVCLFSVWYSICHRSPRRQRSSKRCA